MPASPWLIGIGVGCLTGIMGAPRWGGVGIGLLATLIVLVWMDLQDRLPPGRR